MPEAFLHLAVIIGSTRQGRLGPAVAKWFTDEVAGRPGVSIDVIDLADIHLPVELSDKPGPEVEALSARLAAADAFVIVTPEYNHSFPAPLKTLVDWHYSEWRAKPVGFVSYGGMSGGLRAVEQLRQIFAELHAVTVRDSVSLHGVWSLFNADGQLKEASTPSRSAARMMDQLTWWARALRDARAVRPYVA